MSKLFQLIFNSTAKNIVFFLQVQIILLCYISSANSIPLEKRQEIYRKHGCEEGKCDIFEIESLSRQKRSVDSTISFSLKRYGSDRVLNFRKSEGILVRDNIPVFFGKSVGSEVLLEKQLGLFSSEVRSQLYEDEANLATVVLEFTSGKPEIKCGYIASENLIFSGLPSNDSQTRSYLAKFADSEIGTIDGLQIGSKRWRPRPEIPIPDYIYPEILVIVDYNLFKRFNKETIIPYLFVFWSGVDMYFRQLQYPMFKLSMAGVVIAEDFQVFDFMMPRKMRTTISVDFDTAVNSMSNWLIQEKSLIPFNSYDLFMIMTSYTDESNNRQSNIGLGKKYAACNGINYNHPVGGIIADPNNFKGIYRAAHSLGYMFGAEPDSEEKYIMSAEESLPITRWSAGSIEQVKSQLNERDFSCMYNRPEILKNKPFHITLTGNRRMVVSKYEFAADKVIKIYYEDDTLIVTQENTRKSSVAKNLDDSFLKIAVTDDNVIEVDPDKISQWSKVIIYHEDQFIYAYQGRKPVPENNNNVLENNPKDLSPNYFKNDDSKMCFNKTDFDSDKLVKIYYENNKIHVSQRNVPDFERPNERKSSYLQYIGSELGIIYLYLTEINWDKKVCVQHDGNSIFVYQGEKPDLNRRENNSGKIKYLPDESYVNRKLPESKERKQSSEFNLTLDTDNTFSIFPNEFNLKKLVSISFENDKLIISQVGTPDEKIAAENMIFEDENLMFITSDVNKLLMHPMRLTSKKEVHILHKNKKIKVWQGSYDSPPSLSFNYPDIIEILTENSKSSTIIDDIKLTVENDEVLEIFSGEFDPLKSVLVVFKNNKLEVTQKKQDQKIPNSSGGYRKLKLIQPDSETIEFFPVQIDPTVEIRIRHQNGKIYVWQGSQMPRIRKALP